MTPFEKKVLKTIEGIPKGEIRTYKQIAKEVGSPNSSRAVGNALNKNPLAPKIPCHRVIKSDGSIGGYVKGVNKKKSLLRKEGIKIKGDRVIYRF